MALKRIGGPRRGLYRSRLAAAIGLGFDLPEGAEDRGALLLGDLGELGVRDEGV